MTLIIKLLYFSYPNTEFHIRTTGFMVAYKMEYLILEALRFTCTGDDDTLLPSIVNFLSNDLKTYLEIERKEIEDTFLKYDQQNVQATLEKTQRDNDDDACNA